MKQMTLPKSRARNLSKQEPQALDDGKVLAVYIPGIRLKSLNKSFAVASRGAMFAARSQAKKQRQDVAMVLRSRFGPVPPAAPLTVTITRIAPQELDCDNNVGSAKHVRDGVADWLGVDDRTSRSGVAWKYAQAKDGRAYGVVVKIEGGAE